MSAVIPSIQSLTLDLPPSCIEFCPAHSEYFVVGTYSLEQDDQRAAGDLSRPQNRNGSLVIFRLHDEKIDLLHTIPQPSAILDLHFKDIEGKQDIFAVASSTATLTIYQIRPLQNDDGLLKTLDVIRIPGIEKDVLFLSCVWHPNLPDIIAVSTSTGGVYVLNLQQPTNPDDIPAQPVILHSLEAWTVAFQPYRPGEGLYSLYSGGDDSKLRYTSCTTTKQPALQDDLPTEAANPVYTVNGHDAGVTAILPLPIAMSDGSKLVVTGSYDDHIRVYLIRNPLETGGIRQERCLADQNLGGGVWRLKTVRYQSDERDGCWRLRVLASCMHAGTRVVDIDGDTKGTCRISVMARFEEHKSMNYGSDFQPGSSLFCVSTSFYDKLLCLWKVETV